MKFTTSFIVLVAVLLSQTTVAASVSSAAEECGALGAMEVPEVLPEGVVPSDVRKCSGHPLEVNGEISTPTNGSSLVPNHLEVRAPKACELGAPYGCTRGFCWKVCDTGGKWCWTASKGGLGAWNTCTSYLDCGDGFTWSCGIGCPKCGCSC